MTARNARRIGVPDIDQLIFARDQKRVIVTMDSDFIALATRGTPHTGIAYTQPGSRAIGELVQALMLIYEVLNPEQMRDHVEYL